MAYVQHPKVHKLNDKICLHCLNVVVGFGSRKRGDKNNMLHVKFNFSDEMSSGVACIQNINDELAGSVVSVNILQSI